MTISLRKGITLVAVLIAITFYILLGLFPASFNVMLATTLFVCGLVLLYLVNAAVGKRSDDVDVQDKRSVESHQDGGE